MRKCSIMLVLIICMILNLSACNEKEKNKNLQEVSIILDWYPNAVHAFIYEAMEKGYYEEEGLKVKIFYPANTNDAISLTAAGKADIGIYYLQDVVMAKVNEKIPVKAIGTIVQKSLNIVLSLKEKGINSPEDLIGKKLGYGGSVLSETLIETMLESVNSDMKSVDVVDVGFDLLTSMNTGRVDATLGCMVNHEVPQMEEQGLEVQYFYPKDYGVPDSYELIFVTGEDQIKNESDKLERFLRASRKGFNDMKANPDEALQILLENQNKDDFPLIESVEKKSMDILIPAMETEQTPFLYQDKNIWQQNMNWMAEKGLLEKAIDASEILVDFENE